MPEAHGYLQALLRNIGVLRERAGLTPAQLEERLILGPGWIERFESGESVPSIDMMLAILHETGAGLQDLLHALPEPEPAQVERIIFAEQVGNAIRIHFRYAKFDAQYTLPNARLEEFEAVIKTLRDGLSRLAVVNEGQSEAIKSDSVARAFLTAVRAWPHANPSDLWWFLVYRAYCDPYNHPAQYARLDFTQSWKRTGGWALEEVLVRYYGPFLKQNGVNLYVADGAEKQILVDALRLEDRVEADKIDVVLTGGTPRGQKFFGVVHVKASFAERRTDDVPLSIALVGGGFTSPLWTMDCKSAPGENPVNRGELGDVERRRSAKRKDIEDEGYFTGCFSYNRNTQPTPPGLPEERRVHVCDFSNPDDAFSRFIIRRWQAFPKDRARAGNSV
ncbi:MAG: helix-turn-helix domain-containing protein [Bryobacterales bacterium]|nr:helix-turn-helix domain-containing protein [Bryobacterales bacterium]